MATFIRFIPQYSKDGLKKKAMFCRIRVAHLAQNNPLASRPLARGSEFKSINYYGYLW